MRIVLDPGHTDTLLDGTPLSGKMSPDGAVVEGVVAKNICDFAADGIRLLGHSVCVIPTYDGDRVLPRRKRVEIADRLLADVYISVHTQYGRYNYGWSAANGALIHHGIARGLALAIAQGVSNGGRLRLKNGYGIQKSEFFEITKQPDRAVVLMECGYLTNKNDAAYLGSREGQKQIATAIVAGVHEWRP